MGMCVCSLPVYFCEVRPTSFPGWMLYKASKPGLRLLCSFCVVVYFVMDACLLFIFFDLVFSVLDQDIGCEESI